MFEGQELVLTCSVTGIPEPVRISWFRSSRPVRTQASGRAELRIAKVEGGSAGEYYCVARTGHRSFSSQPVAISVKGASATRRLRSDWVSSPPRTVREGEGAVGGAWMRLRI